MRTGAINPEASSIVSQRCDPPNAKAYLRNLVDVLGRLPISDIDEVVARLFQTYQQRRAVYLFGNGGSAALASHAACDLGKGTAKSEHKPFRVISLVDNVPLITAWANDTSYEDIFAAQLRPLMAFGDVAFAISGSGNSPNVLKALQASREAGGFNIGLTGFEGGKMKPLCDLCITIPSESMQHIEDSHVCVMHAVFVSLRQLIYGIHFASATGT